MKLTNMIVIMAGMMLLLFLAGINQSVGQSLGQLGIGSNPTDLANSFFFQNIGIIIGTAAVAGVTISFFTKTPAENILIVPIVLFLLKFLSDWVGVVFLSYIFFMCLND